MYFFFICTKMYINSSAKYYQDNKERLQKRACERYQRLSNKEKEKKKQQYGREQYKILPEDEKQKLDEYRKKYYKLRKNALLYNYKKLLLFRKFIFFLGA